MLVRLSHQKLTIPVEGSPMRTATGFLCIPHVTYRTGTETGKNCLSPVSIESCDTGKPEGWLWHIVDRIFAISRTHSIEYDSVIISAYNKLYYSGKIFLTEPA